MDLDTLISLIVSLIFMYRLSSLLDLDTLVSDLLDDVSALQFDLTFNCSLSSMILTGGGLRAGGVA